MARRTLAITLSADEDARLRLLAARTERAIDDLLHEAVAALLERYREHLPEQLTWPAIDGGSPAPAGSSLAAPASSAPASSAPASATPPAAPLSPVDR